MLVHLSDDESARKLFTKYELDDVPRIADPERRLYAAFDLNRGRLTQVAGPGVWWKGFKTTLLRGHLPGQPKGDVMQLPGTFVYHNGEIVSAHRPTNTAEHPEFVKFARDALEAHEGN